ncbi:MAG: ATP-binding protein [Acidobacteriota bacterium]
MTPVSGSGGRPDPVGKVQARLARRMSRSLPFDTLSLGIPRASQEELLVVPVAGSDGPPGRAARSLPLALEPFASVFAQARGVPVRLSPAHLRDLGQRLWEPAVSAGLIVPIRLFGQVVGTLNLGRGQGPGFSPQEAEAARQAATRCLALLSRLTLHFKTGSAPGTGRSSDEQLIAFSKAGWLIVQEKDLDRICNLFMEALRKHAVFRRGILTLLDDDLTGYKWFFFGMTDEEIEYFHSHSSNKMTRHQRAVIFQEKYRVGNSYYLPAGSDWTYTGVRARHPEGEAEDSDGAGFLFIPLYGSHKRLVGIVAVDDPVNGRAHTADALSSLELFANQVAHAIEQKKLDLEVKKSTRKYKTLVETMNDGLVVMDLAERITLVNPAMCKLVGYRMEEMIGSSFYTFLSETSRKLVVSKEDERKLGIKSRYEVSLGSKEGAEIPVLMSGAPLYDSSRLVGSFAVVSDLREQKQAESEFRTMHREIVEANKKLQESMARLETTQEQLVQAEKLSAIGELVAGVAHELNNPLTGVLGYAQLLVAKSPPEPQKKQLQTIYSEALRCQKIVQNLLTFARKHKPEKRHVDINEIITATLELRAYQLRVDNITVKLDLDPGLPGTMADYHQLQQVFINLVNNAHHAMVDHGGKGELRITSRAEAGRIHVTCQDTGPGIPETCLGRIFDPFFTTKEVGKGTGLGLSLSYGIIKEHGGTIQASNAPGGGAIFCLELPVRQGNVPAKKARVRARPPGPPTGSRILVVDDEKIVLELLSDLLSSRGHRVEVAENGRVALERLKADREGFDLLITDMKMPAMGGRELYEAVREIAPDLSRRVVFATGDTVSEDARAFLAATGNRVISKPFQLEEMEKIIDDLFAGEDAPRKDDPVVA